MGLPCFVGRVSSPLTKGHVLARFGKKLVIPSCSVDFRQPNDVGVCKSSSWVAATELKKSCLLPVAGRPFSTSPSLLAQHKNHDHSKIWTFERLLATTLLPLTPAALLYPSQPLDTALALIIVLHTHFGLEAIVVDYIRPIIFGEVIPKISLGLLYLFSIVTLAGLLNLIYNDTGLANAIINVWKK